LHSLHTRRNFETTARRFLAELAYGATLGRGRMSALAKITHAVGDAGANDPAFASRKGGGRLTERAVNGMVKRAAKAAGINEAVSPHWLRHAHGSHAIERGASLPEVQATLGHGNIAPTRTRQHRDDKRVSVFLR
jgi:integrase/recombinase XerD